MKIFPSGNPVSDTIYVYKPTRRRFLHSMMTLPVAAVLIDLILPQSANAVVGTGDVVPHELRFTTRDRRDPGNKLILIFMQGGLSFFDTFDPKTHSSIKGPYRLIPTTAEGVKLTEHLSPLARHANDFLVVNNLRGGDGFHDRGAALLLTSSSKVESDSFYSRSVYTNPFVEFSNLLTNEASGQIGYVVLHQSTNDTHGYNRSWEKPWGSLKHEDPTTVYSAYDTETGKFTDPFRHSGSVPAERYRERMGLLESFDSGGHTLVGDSVERHNRAYRQAHNLLSGRFNESCNLDMEPIRIRDRYGNSKIGKQLLLARRMLEKGARVIAANDGNYDMHQNMKEDMDIMLPDFARALSALLDDIKVRMNEKVYVVIVSEFGRTPRVNSQRGRDHWTDAFGMVVMGNDMSDLGGGRTIGRTNDDGRIVGRAFDSSLVGETILELLGLGRFEKRGNVVTGVRFPFIDLKNA